MAIFYDIIRKAVSLDNSKNILYSRTFNFRAPICAKKGYIHALLIYIYIPVKIG